MVNFEDLKEECIMCYDFESNSPVSKFFQWLRWNYLNDTRSKKGPSTINASREFEKARLMIDRHANDFGQQLAMFFDETLKPTRHSKAYSALSKDKIVAMIAQGKFHGSVPSIDSTLAFNLGRDTWSLFQKRGSGTIDERVTSLKISQYLSENKALLRKEGFDTYIADHSGFCWMNETELLDKGFMDERGIDFLRLVPLLVPVKHVVLSPIESPIYRVGKKKESKEKIIDEFLQSAPTHLSYRFKHSLLWKIFERLCSDDPIVKEYVWDDEGKTHTISDWIAYRKVVKNYTEVGRTENALRQAEKIGPFDVKVIESKDLYKRPKEKRKKNDTPEKDEAYRARHLLLELEKGNDKFVAEIQIVDLNQYFLNEIYGGPERHKRAIDTYNQLPSNKKALCEYYRPILEEVIGKKDRLVFDIPR